MRKFELSAKAAVLSAATLLLSASLAPAQQDRQVSQPYWQPTTSPAPAAAQLKNRSAFARMTPAAPKSKEHRLILQVNTNDAAAMNLALNNAMNVTEYYKDAGDTVKIEVIAFGPGLNMLREDTSPVKARIETMALSAPEVSFKACGNTQENMRKAENKEIPLIPQAKVVKSGVVRVMELEERGWTYVKP